jgi:histidinol dehydrogenase
VLARVDLRGLDGSQLSPAQLRGRLPRARLQVDAALDQVRPICRDVQARGLAAVRDWTERLDGVLPAHLRVPEPALREALSALPGPVRRALVEAAERTRRVHAQQVPAESSVSVVPGGTVTRRFLPVNRVGLYVPGGLVAYPSSVVMNVVPAQAAGVAEVAVASPPQADGRPHPAVLAACALLGVTEVYAVGGAQAIAAFAYGVGEAGLAPVDVITGPGNVYVAAAKRLVAGLVGIDAEAGPTEIAVLADASAPADVVAADLLAQAEHDPLAACLLVTPDEDLAGRVDEALSCAVRSARHRERITAALQGQSATVLVDDLDAGLAVTDAWAPEHLEILTADAADRAKRVQSAGAVFVGPCTPVSLGDYLAGSNHVLPTGGTARHASGLSALTFVRAVNVVEYDRRALAAAESHVVALGGAEDLPGHVDAVAVRLRTADR